MYVNSLYNSNVPTLICYPQHLLPPNFHRPFSCSHHVMPVDRLKYSNFKEQKGKYLQPKEEHLEEPSIETVQKIQLESLQNLTHRPKTFLNHSSQPTQVKRRTKSFKPKGKGISFRDNYKHRNVFKSIVRRMNSCIQGDNDKMKNLLVKAGFDIEDIKAAYSKLSYYKDMERKSGKKEMGPQLIRDAVDNVSIYTYVLREALELMLNDLEDQNKVKIARKNIRTYKKVCKAYFDKISELLETEWEGAARAQLKVM